MKKFSIPFVLAILLLAFGCASARQTNDTLPIPKWITDQGRLELFPSISFVSSIGYGSIPQESKQRAASDIAEFIKSSVTTSSSANYFYNEYDNDFEENKKVTQDIKIAASNDLYSVEYTNPYYDADRAQYACVAYIDREKAFNFVRPKLEIAKRQFPTAYYAALKNTSLLDKIVGIRRSHKTLLGFYEVYNFARAINPAKARAYEEVDLLASESLAKMREIGASIHISVKESDDDNLSESSIVLAELLNQFKQFGLHITNSSNSAYSAIVKTKIPTTERDGIFECFPELYIYITEFGKEKISYAKRLQRVSAANYDTFMARIRLALTNDIKTSFIKECF